jgi:glycerol-3-phosphate dehydrogenase
VERQSSLNRSVLIHQLESTHFDILIIGGGITGAGLALDAASRGLKTALIEKGDYASGTSSKSTKLIHGGLRYLKNMEFLLVREVGKERKILLHSAPHLVIPEKMLLPMIKGGQYGKRLTAIGLWIYDLLISVSKGEKKKMLNAKQTLEAEPLLNQDLILASGLYTEYRTDDARLTVEVIKTAAKNGAVCLNYCPMHTFKYTENIISGISCKDEISGREINIQARLVINAAGPWVDEIRKHDHLDSEKKLHLTKGVHIVFNRSKIPLKQSIYFDSEDGRMIFAIPRGDTVYVGTTDTDFSGPLEKAEVNKQDTNYLITAVKRMFNLPDINDKDVISSWAGIRPLIHEENKAPSQLSRKDEIFISPSGLISIAGGKLTAYRKMSEKVIDIALRSLEKKHKIKAVQCTTESMQLSGGEFTSPETVRDFINETENKLSKIKLKNLTAEKLVRLYGRQTEIILNKLPDFGGDDDEEKLIRSELWFCIHFESVLFPEDFFERRSARLFFEPESVQKYWKIVISDMKKYLGWNDDQSIREQVKIASILKNITTFNKE